MSTRPRRRVQAAAVATAAGLGTLAFGAGTVAGREATLDGLGVDTAALHTAPDVPALRAVHSPGDVTVDLAFTAGQCTYLPAADGQALPDPDCTPGAIDPAVTQANIGTTICVPGYTSTVRPSSSETRPHKLDSAADYVTDPHEQEYDHLISLQLGGANATSNLWVQPSGGIPNEKDVVERRLNRMVCAGEITLAEAQHRIAADWTTALVTE